MHDTAHPPAPPGARDTLRSLFDSRPFRFYLGSRVAAMVGQTVQAAIIAWQVYELTGSALSLGFLGVARFVPSLISGFVGGALADTQDRRLIIGISQLAPLLSSLLLALLTATGTIGLPQIYACVAVLGLAGAFEGPARQSLLPQVVPALSFQRAVAVATTVSQLGAVVGPATGGLIIARLGIAPAYLYHVAIIAAGLVCLLGVRILPDGSPRASLSLGLIREGIVFVWTHPPVFGAMAIDMVAVILAGVEALLPIYAEEILGVGAVGYGLLSSAKAVGAFGAAITMTVLPPILATGRTLVISIVLYGIAIIAFGLSTWFPLSLLCYALTAACDQVSVVMRSSIIQLGTPNPLRGRVASVNAVFVGASNQLGPVRAGLVATITGSAVVTTVAGGVGCLVGVAILLALIPSLWPHRMAPPTGGTT